MDRLFPAAGPVQSRRPWLRQYEAIRGQRGPIAIERRIHAWASLQWKKAGGLEEIPGFFGPTSPTGA